MRMKRSLIFAFKLMLIFVFLLPAGCLYATGNDDYANGEILVKFKEDVQKQRIEDIIMHEGASIIKHLKGIDVYHLKLKEGQSVRQAIDIFSTYPEVQYAEPNYLHRPK